MFTIISPVINKLTNNKFNVSSNLDIEKYMETKEVSSENLNIKNEFNIKEMYVTNLKIDIKAKIESKGFIVENIDLKISDDDEYIIENIKIEVSGEKDNKEINKKSNSNVIGIIDTVEKVSVDISSKIEKKEKEYSISAKDAKNLKEYISNIYDVNMKNIVIS